MRFCNNCKRLLPIDILPKHKKICLPCKIKAYRKHYYKFNRLCKKTKKEWYQENKELTLLRSKKRQTKRQMYLNRLKTTPCKDCGRQYNPWQMQFDHRNPEEKLFGIASFKNVSLEVLNLEIAKCDVVCANCHADRTHNRHFRRIEVN